MEAIKLYFEIIIKPLETEVKKQKLKIKKRKFSLTKNIEKEYLSKLEKLLNYYYKQFGNLINNELK